MNGVGPDISCLNIVLTVFFEVGLLEKIGHVVSRMKSLFLFAPVQLGHSKKSDIFVHSPITLSLSS